MGFTAIDGSVVQSDQLRDTILESMTDGVYFVDRNRRILYWNKAAEKLTGYPANQVIGSSCADGILMHIDEWGRCLCKEACPLASVMDDGAPAEAHVFMHHAEGHRVPVFVRGASIRDKYGDIIGAVEVFTDDSEHVVVLDRLKELEQAALVDELTGLANRRYFNRAIEACIADFVRNKVPFGLLLLDIDNFKDFNDHYGHDVGDLVLQMVGKTLACNCRPYDTPARWGGEEFAVISERITDDILFKVADRIRILVENSSRTMNDEDLHVTVSIGASAIRRGDTVETIMKRADHNLYISKESGRNRTTIDG